MTTKHSDLLRSIPVPPVGSEENFAFMAVEQILNFAFNRYLGNLEEQGYLSKTAQATAHGWVDGHPGPLLQLKFDTMDQVQERFTPNIIRMARDFFGERSFKPGLLNASETSGHNPALGKQHLYQLLKDFALSQNTKHFQSRQKHGWWHTLKAATQRRKQRDHSERMLRLLRLAMAVPCAGGATVNADDAAFLNGPGTRFLTQEQSDPCFPQAVDVLNGLAFLTQNHPDFVTGSWRLVRYNPETSLRKSFENLLRSD